MLKPSKKIFKRTLYYLNHRHNIAYAKLFSASEEYKEEADHFKTELNKAKAAYDEKMTENIQLGRNATELNAECERQKRITNELSCELDKLKLNMKKLSIQLNQRQEDINKLVQNNKAMDQEIKDQNNYINKLHTDNNRISNENSQLKKLQDDYMKENAQLWEENKGLKLKFNEAKGMIEVLNNDIELSKQHINALIPENDNIRQYADELKSKLEQVMDENKKMVQDYEVMKEQDAIKVQTCVKENKRLKEEVNKLKIDKEKLKVSVWFLII